MSLAESPQPPLEATCEIAPFAREDRLSLRVKLAYGMPNFAGAAMVIPIAIHMNIFYSDTVLVPLGYIALAVALARSFDAITDPLMGWITDRTRTRWGRRRPWILLGAPLCAVAFVLLFSPPASLSSSQAAVWFSVTFVLYFLFHTIYTIPHYGLGPELTLGYHERSSLYAVSESFTLAGTMCAAALPGLVLDPLFGQRTGFTVFALIFGVLLIIFCLRLCHRVRERPDFYEREANPLVPGVRRVMRNRPFRILLATYLAGSITGAIPGLLMPYFTKYVLQVDHPGWWLSIYLLTYFFFGFATLPGWLWAARRFGKYPIYLVSGLMGAVASFSLFFLGEGDVWPTFAILVWAGSAFGVRVFLGPSIQADVIDYDELYTGKRREAQYGALWAIMTKFTVIPSAAVPLAIFASLGYAPNIEQSETVQFAIRAIFGLAPAAFMLISLGIFLFFPIDERVHREILRGIELHRAGESAEDPLTGRRLPPPAQRGLDEATGWFLDHFSERELRRAVERGAPVLGRSARRALLVALAFAAVAGWVVFANVSDLTQKPPLAVTFGVVAVGFSISAVLYHAIRLRAARRLAAEPLPAETLLQHLEITRSLGH